MSFCAFLLFLVPVFAQPPSIDAHILTDPDLPNMPVPVREKGADAQDCAFQCVADARCQGYNWAQPGCNALPCPFPNGCCWLKQTASSATMLNISTKCVTNVGTYIIRAPKSESPLPTSVAKGEDLKNVLYILVDDMRPNLQPYAQEYMYTPNLQNLANSGLTFSRAYCNIAVCSPSRMSFLTGRYPATTRTWNFINHFRQANCNEAVGGTYFESDEDVYKTLYVTNGGAGQCCSFCTEEPDKCGAWTFTPIPCSISGAWLGPCGNCSLGTSRLGEFFSFGQNTRTQFTTQQQGEPIVSGLVGNVTSRSWMSFPQHFKQAGYLTLSTGKIFHTEQGGNGPAPWDGPGAGMPPFQDAPSWSLGNFSMSNVNAFAGGRDCNEDQCSVLATLDGDVPEGTFKFCDRIIRDDAIEKLSYAIDNYKNTSQPFFMAVGFRKPHLPFRHPAPWDQHYPNISDILLPKHPVLDQSVPPIAHHDGSIKNNPYQPLPDHRTRTLRHDYYAAITWMDYNLGKVMDVLHSHPVVANDTVVVFHADHGFSLGEHGQWEKWTNWEHGTRVPLIVRVPWLEKSQGKETRAIVELVDIFPSVAELANNPVPDTYALEGVSFAALLRDPDVTLLKNTSLSVFPRCPANRTDPSTYWRNNDCNLIERTNFFVMGVTIREDNWRYTEWLPWNEKQLEPLFDAEPVGIELYTHTNDTEVTFDGPWEQVNQAGESQYASIQARLAALLRERYNTTKKWA